MRLILSTRKGLIIYQRQGNGKWVQQKTHFVGEPVSMFYNDAINHRWWACLSLGHWGCKMHYSDDEGQNWTEQEAPAYPEGEEVKEGVKASLNYIWALTNGGKDYPDRLLMGTVPGGLFMSEDQGMTWALNRGLWDDPTRKGQWFGGGFDQPGIHSILVDPNNSDHIKIAISVAGVFESRDGGNSWAVKNKGLKANFLPDPNSDVGQDPHILHACTSNFDHMWQQNHCGIFVTTDGAENWQDVSQENGPANFGFAVAVDENDGNKAWVVPGVSDQTRVAVDLKLRVCYTEDNGKSWTELNHGLPTEPCFDIVYRHSLAKSNGYMAFGTTTGNAFVSENNGEHWATMSNYLPMVHAVHFVED